MKTLIHVLMLSLGSVALLPQPADAKPGDLRVTVTGGKLDWAAPESSGYAFLCIGQEQTSGVSEDCYAFYPKAGGKAFVGGPGTSASEYRKTPGRFPTGTVSITRTVSEAQRGSILKTIDNWNERGYELAGPAAIELVRELAQLAGFFVPPRKKEAPDAFVRRLQVFNPER